MVATPQKNPSKGKQFRLVKYFAYASFIVLIIFSFPFSVVVSQQAKDILIKSYEDKISEVKVKTKDTIQGLIDEKEGLIDRLKEENERLEEEVDKLKEQIRLLEVDRL